MIVLRFLNKNIYELKLKFYQNIETIYFNQYIIGHTNYTIDSNQHKHKWWKNWTKPNQSEKGVKIHFVTFSSINIQYNDHFIIQMCRIHLLNMKINMWMVIKYVWILTGCTLKQSLGIKVERDPKKNIFLAFNVRKKFQIKIN